MKVRWRFPAIAVLAATIMVALGAGPSRAETRAHVYLLRGLMNIFSLGMDSLASELYRRGVRTTVDTYADWMSLADAAAARYKAGSEGPIILIGHSLGADAVMEMAAYLGRKGVPVALVVPFDGTQSLAASPNVARVLNITQREYAYMRAGPGFHGSLVNYDVSRFPGIDHLTIDKSPRLHARVVAEVLAFIGARRPAPPNGTPAGAPAGSAASQEASKAVAAPAGATETAIKPAADGTPTIATPERSSGPASANAAPPKPAATQP